MKPAKKSSPPVIIIGSGNVEYILEYDGEIQPGRKHIVKAYDFFGGSCLNYSLRLINTGKNVFPIPFLGNDYFGYDIQKKLVTIMIKNNLNKKVIDFVKSEDFLIPNFQTPKSTIIVHEGGRTIFSQGLTSGKSIDKYIHNQIDLLDEIIPNNMSVMIGHIFIDGDVHNPGFISKKIINTYGDKHLVFANFGNSQLKHGIDFWKEDLRRTDLFQINIGELRNLFIRKKSFRSLFEIINFFRGHSITVIITLNRFGAIGSYGDGQDGIVIAWPLKINKTVDPTGAGDAFAAGMVAKLNGKKGFTFQDFLSGIEEGRDWASYACTTLGASGNCPDQKTLRAFCKKYSNDTHKLLEVIKPNSSYIEHIIDLIDKAN